YPAISGERGAATFDDERFDRLFVGTGELDAGAITAGPTERRRFQFCPDDLSGARERLRCAGQDDFYCLIRFEWRRAQQLTSTGGDVTELAWNVVDLDVNRLTETVARRQTYGDPSGLRLLHFGWRL